MSNNKILDELTGKEIKELIKDGKIKIEELDSSALYALIDNETDLLAFGNGDMELIRLCADRLDEINGGPLLDGNAVGEIIERTKAEYITVISDEEADAKKPARRRLRLKRALIIAAAVIAVIASSVMIAGAFCFDLVKTIRDMVFESVGTQVDSSNVTVYHTGAPKEYGSIEQLIQEEDLDIMYPTKFPEGYEIKYIYKNRSVMGNEIVKILTNDPCVGFSVEFDYTFDYDTAYDIYEYNGIEFYINKLDSTLWQANCTYDNNIYSINAKTYDDLIFIINNLTE